ncbi:MAG: YidC/Oxa1 family membrane protein insertase [Clostridia bacterium]|nr:YidC/Oxa1 family membrane protein insertase [Clostridia bacterium]
MKRLFTKRVAVLALALLMIVTLLSGCAGCNQTVQKLSYSESKLKLDDELSFEELDKIAKVFLAAYPAYNGVEGLQNAADVDAAYTVIAEANANVSDNALTEAELKNVKAKLNSKYVNALISAFTVSADGLAYDYNQLMSIEKDPINTALLKKVAAVISVAYTADGDAKFDGQTGLIVASRGQDYTSKKYDPDSTKVEEMNLTAAYNVIKKANDTVKTMKKNGGAEDTKALSSADLAKLESGLEAKHVNALINAFKQDITVEKEGFFGGLLSGIGVILGWLTRTLGFGSYIVGICIFAILIEILMLPFAIKQQKNSIKQANLRPKEMAIRNKYKGRNDQPTMQKMQAEIQELYQRENFSPFNGCWTLLIQLPIIMALYYIVIDPLRYVFGQGQELGTALRAFAEAPRAAGGLGIEVISQNGTIELLSKMGRGDITAFGNSAYFNVSGDALSGLKEAFANLPNFNIGALNFGNTPKNIVASDWTSWVLLLVPILTFVTYFATAKLNRKFIYQGTMNENTDNRQVACSNSMMDITMPAMSTIFAFAVPAVIGVYWAFRSWLSFAKTVIMSKVMPLPTFTEEDYKAAAKEMAGKKSVKKSERAGAVRSLHYIDDEDFEDTRARGEARRLAIEEREKREKEERERLAKFAVPMKKDRKENKKAEDEKPADTKENDNDKDEV